MNYVPFISETIERETKTVKIQHRMCLHTIFVHPCGHDATSPILTTVCSMECGLGPLPANTLRHDLEVPYNSADPLMTDFLELIDSFCWFCGTKFGPYSSVDASAAENLFWHIPEVECNEHLFTPIDWNTGDYTMMETEDMPVSPTLCATDAIPKATNRFSFDDAVSEEKSFHVVHTNDPEEQRACFAIEPSIIEQDFFEPSLQSPIKSRSEQQAGPRMHEDGYNRHLSTLQHTAQLPTLTLCEMRQLDKMSRLIERELTIACAADDQASSSADMNFDQRIWNTAVAKSPLSTSVPTEDELLQPSPLSLRHVATPEYVQDLIDWSREARDVLARGELLLQTIESCDALSSTPPDDCSVYSQSLSWPNMQFNMDLDIAERGEFFETGNQQTTQSSQPTMWQYL